MIEILRDIATWLSDRITELDVLRGGRPIRIPPFVLGLALCSSVGCVATLDIDPDSAAYQKLASHSLARALARLDVTYFAGKRVTVDVFTLTKDDYVPFVREFVIASLTERGLAVVPGAKEAELKLQVFLPSLGVDQVALYIGTPDLPSPFGTIPAMPIIGQLRDVGRAEMEIYAFDGQSGRFVSKTESKGETNFTINTVLIIFLFATTDLDDEGGFHFFMFEP